jgi:hypothetical protein
MARIARNLPTSNDKDAARLRSPQLEALALYKEYIRSVVVADQRLCERSKVTTR